MRHDGLPNSNTKYVPNGVEVPCVAEHGIVYTRPWVVDLVLDLVGYSADENLVDLAAIEPSCGDGSFLTQMVRRLSSSCRQQGRPLGDCGGSIAAFDLSPKAVAASRRRVQTALSECGWGEGESREIAHHWVRPADFLLDPQIDTIGLGGGVDFVVGNPPYVRLEFIEQGTVETYRKRYGTMTGRADLYVGFFERALGMLSPGGMCAFICADRWMLNQYGSRLRRLITSGGFSVEAVVEMHAAKAFKDEVLAYPAITTVRRTEDQGKVLVAKIERASEAPLGEMAKATRNLRRESQSSEELEVNASNGRVPGYVIVDDWFKGADPWPCVSPGRLKLLKRLEAEFPPLEDTATGTKVGIGIATGADKIFLTGDTGLVEESRLLPVAMAGDTLTGNLEWAGNFLINPWRADGSLVDLADYPKLGRYFESHEAILKRRRGRKNAGRRKAGT